MFSRLYFKIALIAAIVVLSALTLPVTAQSTTSLSPTEAARPKAQVTALSGGIYAVAVQGTYAYVGVGKQLIILDIANPRQPHIIGQTSALTGTINEIVVIGSYAYVAHSTGISVIDISNPVLPTEIGSLDLANGADALAVENGYVYVGARSYGTLSIVRVTEPKSPVRIGSFNQSLAGVYDVVVNGNYVYIVNIGALHIINVSNPSSPTAAGYSSRVSGEAVKVSGNYAFVVGINGLITVNVSNPANLTTIISRAWGWDLDVLDGFVYIATMDGGLSISNVSNPQNPTEVGFLAMSSFAEGTSIAVAGEYAYIATGSNIHVVNITNKSNPVLEIVYVPEVEVGQDSDGDAIPDDIEEYGYDANGDGIVDVNMVRLGANKNHKDIFVYVDWLEDPTVLVGHSHKPSQQSMDRVIKAFANAPVNNPDGIQGIKLHVIFGQGIEENTRNIVIGRADGDCEYDWDHFDEIKAANFPSSMANIAHYSIFAHSLPFLRCLSGIPSGVAREYETTRHSGSDFIVATTPDRDDRTFMHELGHNLGLGHGGVLIDLDGQIAGADDRNYKPNYLSVMNYYFQKFGLRKKGLLGYYYDGYLDYSRFDSSTLSSVFEQSIDEGLSLSDDILMKEYGTRYLCQNSLDGVVHDDLTRPIDWNGDGLLQRSLRFNVDCDSNESHTLLATVNEWRYLRYKVGAIGAFGDGITAPRITSFRNLPEITRQQEEQMGSINLEPFGVFIPAVVR